MINLNLPKPSNFNFSSGPCKKFPGWSINDLNKEILSRSHRSKKCINSLQKLISDTKEILEIPKDYQIAIIPGSTTGAVEAAMWNLLGETNTTILTHDVFSERWLFDLQEQLPLHNLDIRKAIHGELPDYTNIPKENDLVFCWNGSTAGVKFYDDNFFK